MLIPHMKINSKCIKDFSVRLETENARKETRKAPCIEHLRTNTTSSGTKAREDKRYCTKLDASARQGNHGGGHPQNGWEAP